MRPANDHPTGSSLAGQEDAVTLAILSDSQKMTARAPERYLAETRWLADNAAALGVRFALHVGDVVDAGARDEQQFRVAAIAHQSLLDAGVPLLVTGGNHDYDDELDRSRDLRMFNDHVGYGQLAGHPWFAGSWQPGCAENSYALLDGPAGGILLLALEFGPRPEVVAWADRLLVEHVDRTVFVVTHSFLDPDGGRTQPRSRFHPRSYPAAADGLDGEQLWHQLIRRHRNVVAVFCGHQVPGPLAYRVDVNDAGRSVLQSYQNWQSAPEPLMGCLRLITWRPGAVSMWVVDTATGERVPGAGHQVDIDLAHTDTRFPAELDDLEIWLAG